jgi:2-C-methyl-D-erythritol 4-phosphate cytidylyltransferase
VAALPAHNTLKRVLDGRVVATVPRDRLYQVQTPAVFDRALLEQALGREEREGWGCSDELALALRAGLPVTLVAGDPLNLPVSRAESVPFAELRLSGSSA